MEHSQTVKSLTLCIVHDGERVLLGMKKRGFGEGKWNGFGGKVDAGETVEEAATRELYEECGISAKALEQRALFDFRHDADATVLRVHVFRVTDYDGDVIETEEMRPAWFPYDAIPYEQMWKDDVHWLPALLAGERLTGTFWFDDLDDPNAELLRYELATAE